MVPLSLILTDVLELADVLELDEWREDCNAMPSLRGGLAGAIDCDGGRRAGLQGRRALVERLRAELQRGCASLAWAGV